MCEKLIRHWIPHSLGKWVHPIQDLNCKVFSVLVGLWAIAPERFELYRYTLAAFYAAPNELLTVECSVSVTLWELTVSGFY